MFTMTFVYCSAIYSNETTVSLLTNNCYLLNLSHENVLIHIRNTMRNTVKKLIQ